MRAHLIRLVAVMICLLFSWSASGGTESYTFTKIGSNSRNSKIQAFSWS